MGTTTKNLGLTKDNPTEHYDVGRVNANSDKIDTAIGDYINKAPVGYNDTINGEKTLANYSKCIDIKVEQNKNNIGNISNLNLDGFIGTKTISNLIQYTFDKAKAGVDGLKDTAIKVTTWSNQTLDKVLTSLKNDISKNATDITTLKSVDTGLRTDVDKNKTDITNMKAVDTGFRTDILGLQTSRYNLINGGNKAISNVKAHNIADYYIDDKSLKDGEKITIVIKGKLPTTQSFGFWNSGAIINVCYAAQSLSATDSNIYTVKAVWKTTSGSATVDNSFLRIYAVADAGVNNNSSIDWCVLVRGHVDNLNEWIPSKGDIDAIKQAEIKDRQDIDKNISDISALKTADININKDISALKLEDTEIKKDIEDLKIADAEAVKRMDYSVNMNYMNNTSAVITSFPFTANKGVATFVKTPFRFYFGSFRLDSKVTISYDLSWDNLVPYIDPVQPGEPHITFYGHGNKTGWTDTVGNTFNIPLDNVIKIKETPSGRILRSSYTFTITSQMKQNNEYVDLYFRTENVLSGSLGLGSVKIERGEIATDFLSSITDINNAIERTYKPGYLPTRLVGTRVYIDLDDNYAIVWDISDGSNTLLNKKTNAYPPFNKA